VPARALPARALPARAIFATMNLSLYAAVDTIGLGLAVTLEFLGPLSVALLASRRVLDLGCALIAAAAAVLLARPQPSTDYAGTFLALLAAACWAGYILVNRVVGTRLPGSQGAELQRHSLTLSNFLQTHSDFPRAGRSLELDGVGDGSGGVLPSGGCGPGVVSGLVLFQCPAGGLFGVVVVPTAGAGVAGAGAAAFFPGDGVLEVAAPGVAQARRVGAFAVPDLHQVAEYAAGVVRGCFVPVVAAGDGEGFGAGGQGGSAAG
jgi:drug/metabolite transporter (DMT)-like permease